ncbi:MAG TPA: LLM class F420-dependent oxidoreductase [Candidatus Dormibacteraeota bacterium]|nr:LLM class F420-dependent oxidoreductase [Candidatus Dormibacteraeota bacterium]
MRFGLFGINIGPCASGLTSTQVAQAAEAAGFESVWTGEHVVLPDPQVPPSPMPPQSPLLDPAVTLAVVATATTRLRLGTGIIILPQRNPLLLAKELASVDVVSGGRLIFGLGVGYLKPEFDALGIPFEHKGARAMEYLAAIIEAWTAEHPAYEGRFVAFRGIDAQPRPLQRPHPPIVIGGRTPPAYRRAVAHANGWYGFSLDLAETAECLASLRSALGETARPPALGELEISVTPRGPIDRNTVARFAELGVHRLIPYWPLPTAEALIERVRRFGGEVIAAA